ncbi:MAG: acyltransferase [Bacteroidetes bacterium]|nr:MAG: acyltransferase [Bacteroidota bacterium]
MNYTLAVAQIDSVLGDISKNVIKHVEYARRAKEGGAEIVVFPELSLSGYSVKDLNRDIVLRKETSALLRPLVEESHEISILAGCVEESDDFGIYNAALLIEQGTVKTVHRKIYPPTYGMFEELRYFSPGKSVAAIQSRVGKIGVLICEDFWHLALPYVLAQDGASTIIGISASPTRIAPQESGFEMGRENLEHHKAYARLLSSYIVFCNRVGYEDGVNFWGGSEVISPGGEVTIKAKLFDEDLVFAEIVENEVRRARQSSRHFLDDDIHLVRRELRRISKEWRGLNREAE